MKRRIVCLLLILCTATASSCGVDDLLALLPAETAGTQRDELPHDTTSVESEPADRFSVSFDDDETFATDAARRASERIDSAIRSAVKLLNSLDTEPLAILDCDYDTRPKQRDSLKYPQSKEMYDRILASVTAFEDYRFFEKDYPGMDLFNLFVSAIDALRSDHTELFLYSDAIIKNDEYRSGYFMPGDWLNKLCDDREKIRAEVAYCDAVVARILEKMPDGMTNYETCCYFAFVLASGNTYDHSNTDPVNDYQAYTAFVTGKAICSGYAQAFYRLCREAGISCWYCRGTTPTDRHAWNMLDTEDGPVYLDVT